QDVGGLEVRARADEAAVVAHRSRRRGGRRPWKLALARMANAPSEPRAQAAWLGRNAVDALPDGALAQKIAGAREAQRPLRVKLGIDATAPDIHLGHTVVLQKLREFQDAGAVDALISHASDGRVGDPSGRSRPARCSPARRSTATRR